MTTIAWDGETLAADQQMTDGSTKYRTEKIIRMMDGGLIAGAGTVSYIRQAVLWIAGGEKPTKRPEFKAGEGEDGFGLLRIDINGAVWEYDEALVPLPVVEEKYAIGSGAQIALAMMDQGFDAESAVRAAIERDIYSGFGVSTARLRDE